MSSITGGSIVVFKPVNSKGGIKLIEGEVNTAKVMRYLVKATYITREN